MALSSPTKILSFEKWHGAGNDFIVVTEPDFDLTSIKELCHRRYGIGADGVIHLIKPNIMRIYNADGNEAHMCGNALRIAAKITGWPEIKTRGNTHIAKTIDDQLYVSLGKPQWLSDEPILIDSGVCHLVTFDESFENAPVLRKKHDANINFVTIEAENHLHLRVYEKGVEDETYSCGTGAVASAFAVMRLHGHTGPFTITYKNGDFLNVFFEDDVAFLGGPACRAFSGSLQM